MWTEGLICNGRRFHTGLYGPIYMDCGPVRGCRRWDIGLYGLTGWGGHGAIWPCPSGPQPLSAPPQAGGGGPRRSGSRALGVCPQAPPPRRPPGCAGRAAAAPGACERSRPRGPGQRWRRSRTGLTVTGGAPWGGGAASRIGALPRPHRRASGQESARGELGWGCPHLLGSAGVGVSWDPPLCPPTRGYFPLGPQTAGPCNAQGLSPAFPPLRGLGPRCP